MKNTIKRVLFAQLAVGGALLALALCGCSSSQEKSSSDDGLRAVTVPQDFTFATSRSVSLTLSVSKTLVGDGVAAAEVARPDGAVVFRGSVGAGAPLALSLPIPSKDNQLSVTLFVNNEPKKATVDIKDGKASQAFE